MTTLDATERGPAFVLQMAARAQEICVALGAPELTAVDGARNIMRESKAYRSPGALDTVYQDAVKFSKYCETA